MQNIKAINPIIHAPLRLGIMTALSQVESCDFNFLKKTLDASDGNLSTHLEKLINAKYIKAHKTFIGKKPNTSYIITTSGRKEYEKYLIALRAILENPEKK